ncbi:MAG: endopeptidase La [Bdellovibrionales bacterium]|nr:endopeptidase La [Bdellovibrionales bacterium]
MTADFEGNNDTDFKDNLPLLPVRDLVVYPFMILPLFVGREKSIEAVEAALAQHERLIFLASQKDITAESPAPSEIYELGTVAMIMRMRKLPDGRIKILVQGLSKARIIDFDQTEPFFGVKLNKVEDLSAPEDDITVNALMRNIREQLERVITLGKNLSPDILMVLEDITDPGRLADLVASNLSLHVAEGQMILEVLDPIERLHKINDIISRELEILSMQTKIRNNSIEDVNKSQKEYFLREQIKAIKNELNDDIPDYIDDEFGELREKIKNAAMPAEVDTEAKKQVQRLEKMHPDSSESTIVRNYLEWLLDLPWSKTSKEVIDLKYAKEVLDEDHFDLTKIKERILEFLAVRQLKGSKTKGPILCFSGPPGVGKTSLGKSIAKATGREFVRISLGGVKDEAEIRGHRRTYVGSLPGRFIQALKQAQTNNPVILLDEVDKLGGDFKGDPSSALLEVLDPEQNNAFRDHYLNLPFDLSNVMFIGTANVLEDIPSPLRDRMEVLSLSGYTLEEKMAISRRFLIPKQIEENGVTESNIEITEDGLRSLIKNFTAEAGLRNLERKIGSVCRKVAMKVAQGDFQKLTVNAKIVEEFLGPHLYTDEDRSNDHEVGVATGLAWTSVGGQILYIETTKIKGKGLTLTGQLGDVMKESAQTALGHIKSYSDHYCLDINLFENYEIHVHLPAGATPKDGPSAGITLATSIVSLLTGCPVNKDVAMTGEITLTGKVLPIGGLKEKALAAMRMDIKTIIIPWKNKKDLVEIPEEYREKLNFVPVKSFAEVLEIALVGWSHMKLEWKNSQAKVMKGEARDQEIAA